MIDIPKTIITAIPLTKDSRQLFESVEKQRTVIVEEQRGGKVWPFGKDGI